MKTLPASFSVILICLHCFGGSSLLFGTMSYSWVILYCLEFMTKDLGPSCAHCYQCGIASRPIEVTRIYIYIMLKPNKNYKVCPNIPPLHISTSVLYFENTGSIMLKLSIHWLQSKIYHQQ